MLIEFPTGKTLRDNTDLFVKRGSIQSLCPACVAAVLFTLQTNAPSGGQGHRTGIRGGGPLTTLILGDSLWRTCWLAVLERNSFLRSTGNAARDAPQDIFPWMAQTRTSEGSLGTTPEDAHPSQIFWAMPRRILLLFSDSDGFCDLCRSDSPIMVHDYLTKNLGVHYTGPWKHPLSPYIVARDGSPSPVHPKPGGIGYRYWLGLVQSSDYGRTKSVPAAIVDRYLSTIGEDVRLWAFGYDMDNKKARCWYDSCIPLTLCRPEVRESFGFHISGLIRAADMAAFETRGQIRKALFKQGSEVKGDLSFITSRFWQETEAGFFSALPRLRDMLHKQEEVTPALEDWHKLLVRTAEAIFNDLSQTGAFEAADPKRIALAWRGLCMGLYSKKMKQTLGLPDRAPGSSRRKGGTKSNA